MTELDGMAALNEAVREGKWPHTMDAQVWAKEFLHTAHKLGWQNMMDEGMLIGWFANAIMAGYDTARSQAQPPPHSQPLYLTP